MDICRSSPVDGVPREVYSNISVHASRNSLDGADVSNTPTIPVIVNVTLHMNIDVDLQNGDTVIVKIPDASATEIVEAFEGICGDPYTVNSRKRANLLMKQLGRDGIISEVAPLPAGV